MAISQYKEMVPRAGIEPARGYFFEDTRGIKSNKNNTLEIYQYKHILMIAHNFAPVGHI